MGLIEIANFLISFAQEYMIYNFMYKIWKSRYGYIKSNLLTFVVVAVSYVQGRYSVKNTSASEGISIWNGFDSTEQKQANKLISSEGKVNYKSLYNAAEKIRKQCISDDGGNLASIPMTATGKSTSTQLTWSYVKGADGYYVYANRCNKGDKKYKWKCVKTIKSGSTVAYTHKNLLKNTSYKYRIGAYAMINGKKVLIARSLILHSYTTASSPKYKNPSKVTVSNDKVSLKVGKTKKITAKISSYTKGKKISNHVVKIRYIISDPAVASISLSGTIKAKKAGSCTIWACAQNGVRKAIKVTVTK